MTAFVGGIGAPRAPIGPCVLAGFAWSPWLDAAGDSAACVLLALGTKAGVVSLWAVRPATASGGVRVGSVGAYNTGVAAWVTHVAFGPASGRNTVLAVTVGTGACVVVDVSHGPSGAAGVVVDVRLAAVVTDGTQHAPVEQLCWFQPSSPVRPGLEP